LYPTTTATSASASGHYPLGVKVKIAQACVLSMKFILKRNNNLLKRGGDNKRKGVKRGG